MPHKQVWHHSTSCRENAPPSDMNWIGNPFIEKYHFFSFWQASFIIVLIIYPCWGQKCQIENELTFNWIISFWLISGSVMTARFGRDQRLPFYFKVTLDLRIENNKCWPRNKLNRGKKVLSIMFKAGNFNLNFEILNSFILLCILTHFS